MKIRNLQVFVYVIEEGTLARAANRLNTSQPAASRLLRLLEQDLGVALFERRKKRLIPTAAGTQFYPEAARIVASVEGIPALLRQIESGFSAPLRVACHLRVVDGIVIPALARLTERAPNLRFHLEVHTRRNLERLIVQELFDVGVGLLPFSTDSYVREILCEVELQVLVCASHPLASKNYVTLSDLTKYRYVGLPKQTVIRGAIDEMFQKEGLQLDPFHEFSISAAGHHFVRETKAYTISDPVSIGAELREGLTFVPLRPSSIVRYGVFEKRSAQGHPALDEFVNCLKSVTNVVAQL